MDDNGPQEGTQVPEIEGLTDGEMFLMVKAADQRLRGKHRSPSLSHGAFNKAWESSKRTSAQPEHTSAQSGHKRVIRSTAEVTASKTGLTKSFVQRSRFIMDHALPVTIAELEQDKITFIEAESQAEIQDRLNKRLKSLPKKGDLVAALVNFIQLDHLKFEDLFTRDQATEAVLMIGVSLLERKVINEEDMLLIEKVCPGWKRPKKSPARRKSM